MTRSLKKLLLLPLLLWKLLLPHLLLKLLPLLLLKLPLLLLTLLLLLPLTLLLLPPLTLLLLTLPRLTLTPLLALLPPSKLIAYAVMGLRPHGAKKPLLDSGAVFFRLSDIASVNGMLSSAAARFDLP